MPRFLSALLIGLLAGLPCSRGHDSPSHRIDALSARLEEEGPRLNLLIDRGFEYIAVGNWLSATVDFEAALAIAPNSRAALFGCAEAYSRLGRWEDVAKLARTGLSYLNTPSTKAPFYAMLARSLIENKQWDQAAGAWDKAMESSNPEIDWYLGQAEALYQLKEYNRQVEALGEARARNPSVVLYRAWLEALINSGRWEQALAEVNRELPNARWKSSWLLLRARIYQAMEMRDALISDAQAALDEIQSRLHPDRPDPQLVKERDQALTLLKS